MVRRVAPFAAGLVLVLAVVLAVWYWSSSRTPELRGTFAGYGYRNFQTFSFAEGNRYTTRYQQGPIIIVMKGRYKLDDDRLLLQPETVESRVVGPKLRARLMKPTTFTILRPSPRELVLKAPTFELKLRRTD